jgi:hypothetical protein
VILLHLTEHRLLQVKETGRHEEYPTAWRSLLSRLTRVTAVLPPRNKPRPDSVGMGVERVSLLERISSGPVREIQVGKVGPGSLPSTTVSHYVLSVDNCPQPAQQPSEDRAWMTIRTIASSLSMLSATKPCGTGAEARKK